MRGGTHSFRVPVILEEVILQRVAEMDYPSVSAYLVTLMCADLAGCEFRNHDFHDLASRPGWYRDRVHESIVSKFNDDRAKRAPRKRTFKLPAALRKERVESKVIEMRELQKAREAA